MIARPCPRCGKDVTVRTDRRILPRFAFIECPDCQWEMVYYGSKVSAVLVWNVLSANPEVL